jgi:thiamine biosynthesis lipoprotein
VDYKAVRIDGNQVTLADPEAEIDLGGIAKGYVADRVCEKLEECGVTGAIVSLGGNVDCLGSKPDGKKEKDFVVGIEAPYSDKSEIVGSTPASDRTVVTSGVYERFFTFQGREYHHILDPETGYPVDSDVLGVSIAAARGKSADCDALATICLILGSEKGMALIESMDGFEALFITRENKILTTDGFDFTKR